MLRRRSQAWQNRLRAKDRSCTAASKLHTGRAVVCPGSFSSVQHSPFIHQRQNACIFHSADRIVVLVSTQNGKQSRGISGRKLREQGLKDGWRMTCRKPERDTAGAGASDK